MMTYHDKNGNEVLVDGRYAFAYGLIGVVQYVTTTGGVSIRWSNGGITTATKGAK